MKDGCRSLSLVSCADLSLIVKLRATCFHKRINLLKKILMLNRTRRNQFFTSMSKFHALFVLKEAYLLRENWRFWVIIRLHFWFQRIWNSAQFENIDDYWKQEFRFSKETVENLMQILSILKEILKHRILHNATQKSKQQGTTQIVIL